MLTCSDHNSSLPAIIQRVKNTRGIVRREYMEGSCSEVLYYRLKMQKFRIKAEC